MLTTKVNPQYITDNTGRKISVILPMRDFETIMEELEELEDIRLYDDAKKSNEPSIPIDRAFEMIEANLPSNIKRKGCQSSGESQRAVLHRSQTGNLQSCQQPAATRI